MASIFLKYLINNIVLSPNAIKTGTKGTKCISTPLPQILLVFLGKKQRNRVSNSGEQTDVYLGLKKQRTIHTYSVKLESPFLTKS